MLLLSLADEMATLAWLVMLAMGISRLGPGDGGRPGAALREKQGGERRGGGRESRGLDRFGLGPQSLKGNVLSHGLPGQRQCGVDAAREGGAGGGAKQVGSRQNLDKLIRTIVKGGDRRIHRCTSGSGSGQGDRDAGQNGILGIGDATAAVMTKATPVTLLTEADNSERSSNTSSSRSRRRSLPPRLFGHDRLRLALPEKVAEYES